MTSTTFYFLLSVMRSLALLHHVSPTWMFYLTHTSPKTMDQLTTDRCSWNQEPNQIFFLLRCLFQAFVTEDSTLTHHTYSRLALMCCLFICHLSQHLGCEVHKSLCWISASLDSWQTQHGGTYVFHTESGSHGHLYFLQFQLLKYSSL